MTKRSQLQSRNWNVKSRRVTIRLNRREAWEAHLSGTQREQGSRAISMGSFNPPKCSCNRARNFSAIIGNGTAIETANNKLARNQTYRIYVSISAFHGERVTFAAKKINFVKTTTPGETTLLPEPGRKINWEYSFETAKLTRRFAPIATNTRSRLWRTARFTEVLGEIGSQRYSVNSLTRLTSRIY